MNIRYIRTAYKASIKYPLSAFRSKINTQNRTEKHETLAYLTKKAYLCTLFSWEEVGKMAEWSIAAVLKTVDLRGSGGSNPSLSAKQK